MTYFNKEVDIGKDMVNLFKEYFISMYVSNDLVCPQVILKENSINPINTV